MIITNKNDIISFLKGEKADYRGRTYDMMLSLTDGEMERCHDQIQWIWPLHEESNHALTYPVLDKETVEEAKQCNTILNNLKRAKDRFESFLGIGKYEDINRQKDWCHNRNHNLLRVTRAIRCLRLFGLDNEAKELYDVVMAVGDRWGISVITQDYWTNAMEDDPWETLQKK